MSSGLTGSCFGSPAKYTTRARLPAIMSADCWACLEGAATQTRSAPAPPVRLITSDTPLSSPTTHASSTNRPTACRATSRRWRFTSHRNTLPAPRSPHIALIAGAVVGYALSVLIYELGKRGGSLAGQIVGALLYMAVFGAVISYFMQCLAFILLRRRLPDIARPYRSPVGEWGAAIAGAIALVSLVSLYTKADYRPGVYGTLIYFVLGILYFAVAGRHRLVLSPEEEFAVTGGEHGHPETEGYGTTHVGDIRTSGAAAREERTT